MYGGCIILWYIYPVASKSRKVPTSYRIVPIHSFIKQPIITYCFEINIYSVEFYWLWDNLSYDNGAYVTPSHYFIHWLPYSLNHTYVIRPPPQKKKKKRKKKKKNTFKHSLCINIPQICYWDWFRFARFKSWFHSNRSLFTDNYMFSIIIQTLSISCAWKIAKYS